MNNKKFSFYWVDQAENYKLQSDGQYKIVIHYLPSSYVTNYTDTYTWRQKMCHKTSRTLHMCNVHVINPLTPTVTIYGHSYKASCARSG